MARISAWAGGEREVRIITASKRDEYVRFMARLLKFACSKTPTPPNKIIVAQIAF